MDKQSAGQATEIHAADALLDRRLRVMILAPLVLRMLGVKEIPFWLRRSVYAQLLRMSRETVRLGIDPAKYSESAMGDVYADIAVHGKTVSRIVAYGLIRSTLFTFLFHRALARYLRSHMDMEVLAGMGVAVLQLSGAEKFAPIIKSLMLMRMTKPATASQEQTGS